MVVHTDGKLDHDFVMVGWLGGHLELDGVGEKQWRTWAGDWMRICHWCTRWSLSVSAACLHRGV